MVEQRVGTFKRRQFFIEKKFQTEFVLKFLIVIVVGAALSVVATMLTNLATLTSTYEGSGLVLEKTSWAILPSVILTHIGTTLVIGIVAIVVTLLASHKLAGPMYRFEKDLEEIAGGNLRKKIHIRNGDQFGSVARNLNDMVERLNFRVRDIQADIDRVTEMAAALDLPEGFRDELEKCRTNIGNRFAL